MTLWDICAAIIRDRWAARRRRRIWMTEWPYWTKQPRFNIIQRYLMRRAIWIALLLILFKVNPFHPVSIALFLLGLTLVRSEHKAHEEQHRLLYNIRK